MAQVFSYICHLLEITDATPIQPGKYLFGSVGRKALTDDKIFNLGPGHIFKVKGGRHVIWGYRIYDEKRLKARSIPSSRSLRLIGL